MFLNNWCLHVELCVVVCVMWLGVYEIVYNIETNKCAMTWMYENPQFLKIDLKPHVKHRYPKYNLFIYGEGRYAAYLKEMQECRLDGVPVVFVHGNTGSYKQVRSSGSISLNKSNYHEVYHFNYFTVDYKEELSGLYGPFLMRQTKFLRHCILRIFQCYEHLDESKKPSSIIAIGHSMGGLVIRGLLTLPLFDVSKISTVINLATPQTGHPLKLDIQMEKYYDEVNEFWKNEANGKLSNVTFLSFGGGFRDVLVRSDFCRFETTNADHKSLLTDAIPHIWRSTDHQCIVWCNEFIRALTRCFFKMVSKETKQITQKHKKRLKVFENIFFHTNYGKRKRQAECLDVTIINITMMYSHNRCLKIKSINENVNIWTHSTNKDWITLCNESASSLCTIPIYSVIPGRSQSTYFYSGSSKDLFLKSSEVYFQTIRDSVPIKVPMLFRFKDTFRFDKVFFVSFALEGFTKTWQTYQINIKVNNDSQDDVTIGLVSPWTSDIKYFVLNGNESIRVKIFHGIPLHRLSSNNIKLNVWSKHITTIDVLIEPDFVGSIGQLLWFNVEDCVFYILLFSLLRPLVCSFEYIIFKKFKNIFISFFILNIYLYMYHKMFSREQDFVVKCFCLTFSMVVVDVLQHILSFVLCLLMFIVKPLTCILHSYTDMVMKLLILSLLMLTQKIFLLPKSTEIVNVFCFSVLLFLNVVKLSAITEKIQQRKHIGILISILPFVIIFNAIPVVIFAKDFIENTSSLEFLRTLSLDTLPSHMGRIFGLQIAYSIYLLTDLKSYTVTSQWFTAFLGCFIMCYFMLARELIFLKLYNMPTLAALYLFMITMKTVLF